MQLILISHHLQQQQQLIKDIIQLFAIHFLEVVVVVIVDNIIIIILGSVITNPLLKKDSLPLFEEIKSENVLPAVEADLNELKTKFSG